MTTTETPPAAPRGSLLERTDNARRRQRRDRTITVLLAAVMIFAAVPLVLIVVEVLRRGGSTIDWAFFTQTEPSPRREGGGYLNAFVGTLYMVGVASVIMIPLGVLAAVFLVDYSRTTLARAIRFFTDVMTGIPSVFVGLAVFSILVLGFGIGFGTLPGAIAIGIMMLPIVVRASEEVLRTVPDELRNGALALGARRWQTTFKVILPAAAPGLATSAMLAVARAAGETAPLLLTAFGSRQLITDLVGRPQSALPLSIYSGARQEAIQGIERAWAGALALMVIVLVLTVAARYIGDRTKKA